MLNAIHTTETVAPPCYAAQAAALDAEAAEREIDIRLAACALVRTRFAGRAALEREVEGARAGLRSVQRWPQYADRRDAFAAQLASALRRLEAALGLADPLPPTAAELLAAHIRDHGPIATIRVSSAQARGRAKQYAYWGAVRYEIRVGRDGLPTNVACERASSDRRSHDLAERDGEEIAEAEGRIWLQTIGTLCDADSADILRAIGATVAA